jgi:hypothetical protein
MTTMRPRPLTASRMKVLTRQLTGREHAVLEVLNVLHVATTDQIARVVFHEEGQATALRLTRRHLQRLREVGLVRRFDDRAWDRRVGAPGYVHALSAAGLRLVVAEHGFGARQRTSWRPSHTFLTHRLSISELFVRLYGLERAGGPTARVFRAEPDSWRTYTGASGERLALKPDALVRLGVGEVEVSHFVEIDLGTERPATIADKCQAYRAYELSGQEQRRHGVFPGVAFIVPNKERARVVDAVIARQPADARELFAVATEADALAILAEVDMPTSTDRPPPHLSAKSVG